MSASDTTVAIRLSRNEAGQVLDGLEVLLDQWIATAVWHETGTPPDDDTPIRECSGAREANVIAETYRSIYDKIYAQLQ